MNTYVIHATCRYVVQNKKTKVCEKGQNRPTIAIEASSEQAAIRKATVQQKKAISSPYWPCISFHLVPELVNVVEHPTAQQLKVLRECEPGLPSDTNKGMRARLIQKGWVDGATHGLTSAGRAAVAR